jgi:hypothetical protein
MKSIITLTLAVLILFIPFTLWADYQLNVIFDKDLSFWAIFGSLFLIALVTPKKLNGLTLFALVIGQLYIWFFM